MVAKSSSIEPRAINFWLKASSRRSPDRSPPGSPDAGLTLSADRLGSSENMLKATSVPSPSSTRSPCTSRARRLRLPLILMSACLSTSVRL